MHFEFALDLSDIDLWNIDLLDAHLDLLDTDIPSKHFVCLQDILKIIQDISSRHLQNMPSRRLQDMSSKRLEEVFSVTIFCLPRRLEDVFKMSLQDVLKDKKILCWRHVGNVFNTCLEDVFKSLEGQQMFAGLIVDWTKKSTFNQSLSHLTPTRWWSYMKLTLTRCSSK